MEKQASGLQIGWGHADITPAEPCLVAGQFYARVSEQVLDPVTATALALDNSHDAAVIVSCDLVGIPNELRDAVRDHLSDVDGLDPLKVMISATHTHTAPEVRIPIFGTGHTSTVLGVDLDAMDAEAYQPFAARRIADAVRQAWTSRRPGRIAYGQGTAVIGRNRRWVDVAGKATMYGNTNSPDFSHIEGYEDHSLGLITTYDADGQLTGIVVNVACTSQVSEHLFAISADFWHETRQEIRHRFGKDLFVLGQCSAAGDQSPHLLYDKPAEKRMRELANRSERQEIAHRIANGIADVLPLIAPTAASSLPLVHHVQTVNLPMNALTEDDVRNSLAEAEKLRVEYDSEIARLDADGELRRQTRWYMKATSAFRRMRWFQAVADRYEAQKTSPTMPVEFHVIRLGDLAMASNPFEFYLDFGTFIKARSPAVHTFLVQLAGGGTYCPSPRSLAGKGYGSLPASNPVGPAGGRLLSEKTIDALTKLWA